MDFSKSDEENPIIDSFLSEIESSKLIEIPSKRFWKRCKSKIYRIKSKTAKFKTIQ